MFENYRVFETEFAGRKMTFETGKLCALSNASVLVRYGETAVLCNATASQTPREGIDYFPLSVDFDEKLYSIGRIPGSFPRREGRPTDRAILDSRVVDRPMRPLFPKDMRNDCSIVMSALSVDLDNPYAICGMNGASMAVAISDIPWNGPIAGCQVGLVGGEIVLNPTAEQEAASDLHLIVASTAEKVVMIEADALGDPLINDDHVRELGL
ncbi:MAG TPA: polyribonucleotide nucleotidyltransferase, partial [Oscillospiraceae bacterium]|nr:polyribonucleotide nucleotidyltransferase [Oscillospiraceae bacterium]